MTATRNRPGAGNTRAVQNNSKITPESRRRLAREARVARRVEFTPAPVDGGLGMLCGPNPHPDSAPAIWREYDRPPAPPWGSYLDTEPLPLPPGGGGPFSYAMDVVAQGVVR